MYIFKSIKKMKSECRIDKNLPSTNSNDDDDDDDDDNCT